MLERLHSCNDTAWYGYFSENMDGLGLESPESMFGSLRTATASLGPAAALVGHWGGSMPVANVVGATFFWEKLALGTAALGVFYAGAAVGSSAVATGRYLGCGTSLSDVLMELTALYPNNRGAVNFIWDNPEVVLPNHPSRNHYRMKANRRLQGLVG